MNDRIRVLIVGESGLFRAGLRALVGSYAGIAVVDEADPTRETVALARRLAPAVAVLDSAAAKQEEGGFVRELAHAAPLTRLLVLTESSDCVRSLPALAAGAQGLLPETSGGDELAAAIRTLANDGVYLPASATRLLCDRVRARERERRPM